MFHHNERHLLIDRSGDLRFTQLQLLRERGREYRDGQDVTFHVEWPHQLQCLIAKTIPGDLLKKFQDHRRFDLRSNTAFSRAVPQKTG